jgi:hypothetical protein
MKMAAQSNHAEVLLYHVSPTVLVARLSLVSTAGAYCTPATAVSQRTD